MPSKNYRKGTPKKRLYKSVMDKIENDSKQKQSMEKLNKLICKLIYIFYYWLLRLIIRALNRYLKLTT